LATSTLVTAQDSGQDVEMPQCLSGNFCLKALGESRYGLPSKRLSGTSFNFLIWKNESNQTHGSGRTLTPVRWQAACAWSDDDYDVFDGARHIGRIMWTHAAPAA
jgi:hypothetical protein